MPPSSSSATVPRRTTVLVIDDQPYELVWLVEFLEAHGYKCEIATTLKDGVARIEASEHDKYRILIVDMEISADGFTGRLPKEVAREKLYRAYPGLSAVQAARNYDYQPSDVLVYSVHQSNEINAEVSLLRCKYILKGRPRRVKDLLLSMLGIATP